MTTLPQVELDQELCIGSGECAALAPNAFSLEDANLTVTVLATAPETDLETLRDAEMSCPTGAIRIVLADSS